MAEQDNQNQNQQEPESPKIEESESSTFDTIEKIYENTPPQKSEGHSKVSEMIDSKQCIGNFSKLPSMN